MNHSEDKSFDQIRCFDPVSDKKDGRSFRINFRDRNIDKIFELNALFTGSAEADLKVRLSRTVPLFNEKDEQSRKNILENLFLNQFFAILCANLWNGMVYEEMRLFEIGSPISIPRSIDLDKLGETDIREYPGGKNIKRSS